MNITREVWPLGWQPSMNADKGSPDAYLLAENLTANEVGVLRLTKGTKKVSSGSFGAVNGNKIYSTVVNMNSLTSDSGFVNDSKLRYVGLSSGVCLRNYGYTFKSLTDFELSIITGGNGVFAFGSCFGHVLAFSGTQKTKDRGDVVYDLGIPAAAAPGISSNVPPFNWADDRDGSNFFTRWDAVAEGTAYNKASTYVTITSSLTGTNVIYRGIVQRGVATTTTLDLDAMSSGFGTSEDLFQFNLRIGESDKFIKVRLEYLLETPQAVSGASTTQDVRNYYWHEWTNRQVAEVDVVTDAPDFISSDMTQEQIDALIVANPGVTFVTGIREGVNVWSPLQCKRGDFKRAGSDDSKDWSTVKGIRLTYYSTAATEFLATEFGFVGGDLGTLTGTFVYKQVDCRDTGTYLEEGIPSAESAYITTFASSNNVTLNSPNSQANEIKVYRASNATGGFFLVRHNRRVPIRTNITAGNPTTITVVNHGLVNGNVIAVRDGVENWAAANGSYVVTRTGANTFTIPLNSIGFGTVYGDISYVDYSPFNDYVTDAQALEGGNDNRLNPNLALLPDDIIDVIAPYFDRALYLTTKVFIPSLQNDPSRYDVNHQIELSSDDSEVNLFMAKVAEGVIYIGTTKDIYVLQGNGTIDSIGAIDFKLTSLGLARPPISKAYVVENSTLHYWSVDGWRTVAGSTSRLLSLTQELLYPSASETRHGIPPLRVVPRDGVQVSAVVIGNKMYASMEHVTIGRALHKYDFVTKRWEFQRNIVAANNPFDLFVEEDGTILFTTEASGDGFLHQLDYGNLIDEVTKQHFSFLTVYDDFGANNHRKDCDTLVIAAKSSGEILTVTVRGRKQDGTDGTLVFNVAFTGDTKFFDISSLGACKRYQVEITDTVGVASFELHSLKFEYELRPPQVSFLRIRPENYGVAGRKRIPEIPMVIDTLGTTVTFTPSIDGVTKTASTVTTSDKDSFSHLFPSDEAGYMIGGWLSVASNPDSVFEFYGLIKPTEIEVLPDPLSFKWISYSNLGSVSKKRFAIFAFVIDTRGFDVIFTPFVDGVEYPSRTYNTTRKQTVKYEFLTDAKGIDIGGTLVCATGKFEYYSINLEECVAEKLPVGIKFLRIPSSNFGKASKKRIRTIPLVINTNGADVIFTPYVDGVAYPSMTINTADKRTVLYYFVSDAFGIDVYGTLIGTSEFEFYEMLAPSIVEELPVAKKYDQLGPLELKRIGKIYRARVRVVPTGSAMSYSMLVDGTTVSAGTWATVVDNEAVLEITFPRFVLGTIVKLELSSNSEFHRLYGEILVALSGNDTSNKWVQIQ